MRSTSSTMKPTQDPRPPVLSFQSGTGPSSQISLSPTMSSTLQMTPFSSGHRSRSTKPMALTHQSAIAPASAQNTYGTTPQTLMSDIPGPSIVNAPVDSPDHNGSIMDIDTPPTHRPGRVVPRCRCRSRGLRRPTRRVCCPQEAIRLDLDDHHGDDIVALTCKAPPGVNIELATQQPDRSSSPATPANEAGSECVSTYQLSTGKR